MDILISNELVFGHPWLKTCFGHSSFVSSVSRIGGKIFIKQQN